MVNSNGQQEKTNLGVVITLDGCSSKLLKEDILALVNSPGIRKHLLSYGDIIKRREEFRDILEKVNVPLDTLDVICREYQKYAKVDLGYINKKL